LQLRFLSPVLSLPDYMQEPVVPENAGDPLLSLAPKIVLHTSCRFLHTLLAALYPLLRCRLCVRILPEIRCAITIPIRCGILVCIHSFPHFIAVLFVFNRPKGPGIYPQGNKPVKARDERAKAEREIARNPQKVIAAFEQPEISPRQVVELYRHDDVLPERKEHLGRRGQAGAAVIFYQNRLRTHQHFELAGLVPQYSGKGGAGASLTQDQKNLLEYLYPGTAKPSIFSGGIAETESGSSGSRRFEGCAPAMTSLPVWLPRVSISLYLYSLALWEHAVPVPYTGRSRRLRFKSMAEPFA
jgi:hypothetical protein